MEDQAMTIQCTKCDEYLEPSKFYTRNTGKLRKECKTCYYQYLKERYHSKRPKKRMGFQALCVFVQKNIIEELENKKTMKSIALKHNINYSTLKSWKKNNKIVMREEDIIYCNQAWDK